ncbi:MAG: hypothetical protein ACOYKM_02400 [Caulobacterales bacterium]|jgi:hypothetical protein
MSPVELITLALSAAGVALLVAIAWAMGFHTKPHLAAPEAIAAAITTHEPGAAIVAQTQDASGRAALALLQDGRFVAVKPVADGLAVRLFRPADLASTRIARKSAGQALSLRFKDLGFPHLTLILAEPELPPWLQPLYHPTQSATG